MVSPGAKVPQVIVGIVCEFDCVANSFWLCGENCSIVVAVMCATHRLRTLFSPKTYKDGGRTSNKDTTMVTWCHRLEPLTNFLNTMCHGGRCIRTHLPLTHHFKYFLKAQIVLVRLSGDDANMFNDKPSICCDRWI